MSECENKNDYAEISNSCHYWTSTSLSLSPLLDTERRAFVPLYWQTGRQRWQNQVHHRKCHQNSYCAQWYTYLYLRSLPEYTVRYMYTHKMMIRVIILMMNTLLFIIVWLSCGNNNNGNNKNDIKKINTNICHYYHHYHNHY